MKPPSSKKKPASGDMNSALIDLQDLIPCLNEPSIRSLQSSLVTSPLPLPQMPLTDKEDGALSPASPRPVCKRASSRYSDQVLFSNLSGTGYLKRGFLGNLEQDSDVDLGASCKSEMDTLRNEQSSLTFSFWIPANFKIGVCWIYWRVRPAIRGIFQRQVFNVSVLRFF